MAEFVWVNVWNSIPLGKFIEPVCQTIRVHVKDISIQGRSAMGVKVVSFKKAKDVIVAMAATEYQPEDDASEESEGEETAENPEENK